jgi:predicted metalloprotease with PDZ domain
MILLDFVELSYPGDVNIAVRTHGIAPPKLVSHLFTMHFFGTGRLEILSWIVRAAPLRRCFPLIRMATAGSRTAFALALLVAGIGAQTPSGVVRPPDAQRGKSYLGVYLGEVNDTHLRELKLAEIRGVIVGKVEMGSPGEKAGLKENDVILSFNEQNVQNRPQFYRLLTETPAGESVQLGIRRDGELRTLVVVLGERRQTDADGRTGLFSEVKALLDLAEQNRRQAEEFRQQGDERSAAKMAAEEKAVRAEAESRRTFIEQELQAGRIQPPAAPRPDMARGAWRAQLGLSAVELGEQLAKYFQVPGSGVLVTEVRAGEPAERAGIKAGDCIVAINGEPIATPADLMRTRSGKDNQPPGELAVTRVREGVEQIVKIRIESR